MTLAKCIVNGQAQGIIPSQKSLEFMDDFNNAKGKYLEQGMSEEAAARQAGRDTFDNIKFQKARKADLAIKQAKAQARFNYLVKTSGLNPGEIMERVLGKQNVQEGFQEIFSAEVAIAAAQVKAQKHFGKILVEFDQTMTGGVKKKAGQIQMLKEIIEPGSTGNAAARELAEAWTRTSELLRKMFNERGGAIAKIDGNYLPQFHDQTAVASTKTYEPWRDFLLDNELLDLEKMIDYRTGQVFTREQLELALKDVWDSIVYQGANKKTHHLGYGKAMYNKRLDHRFLHFKNADAWMQYNSRFGGDSSIFDIMVGHFQTMTRDIGLMDVLGANPDMHIRWMAKQVNDYANFQAPKLSKTKFEKLQNKMNKHIYHSEAMYMYLKGQSHAPVSKGMAVTMATLRGIQTMGKLGSAPVLALLDINFARHTAAFAGLPQTKFMRRHLQQVKQLPKSEWRKIAAVSDVVAESYMNVSSASARFTADMTEQTEVTRRLTDFSLKASGLNWQTQAGANAAGLEYMAQLARLPKDFNKLPKKFQQYLETFGIGAENWKIIKETKPWTPKKDAEFLQPSDILDRADLPKEVAEDLFNKLYLSLNRFIDFARPSVNAKAATTGVIVGLGKTQSGTAVGELVRSILQFKQFPMTLHHTHIMRGMLRNGLTGKAKYLVPLFVSSTLMGAMAYEMKQILKGKDVTSTKGMSNPKYWFNAAIHAGGLGFYADLLFSTRYSAASGATGAFGALPGFFFDTLELVTDNIYEGIAADQEMNLGADVSRYLRRHTPGASHWYLRLAMERLVFDFLQSMIDPKWKRKRSQKINKTRKKDHTDFWWRPGDLAPNRPPNFN